MTIERHFWASGLHRQGYTIETALKNPAIAKALACAELAAQRHRQRSVQIQNKTTHNKGAPNDKFDII